ncbi:leucine-rich repeat protein [Trueperella bialowiezensis]|uniref:Probable hemoglobin and hemoglobin-haptoglobin-binding protein 3 n=1 Tax=Trueperella bialowiezensis TaxID=312285 RepID=A0A448PCQ4_9ACTO|nr:leucine-rich repeat protein [Trueperella bialowiezensis]VEI12657.1 Probable hemoglobin and hemoglobin-haptoglobin-binding protein 3 precursor [Trueperella bialowiezensis]
MKNKSLIKGQGTTRKITLSFIASLTAAILLFLCGANFSIAEATTSEWKPEDFKYSNTAEGYWVDGLSASGEEKIKTNKHLVLPEATPDGVPVTGVGKRAFLKETIEELTVPGNIRTIDDYAFQQTGLKKVTFNEGLEKINEYSFENNDIRGVSFPSTLKQIGALAFQTNPNMGTVVFQEGIQKIKLGAFIDNGLTGTLNLPDSLQELGGYVFSYNKLTGVRLPAALDTLPAKVFAGNRLREHSITNIENVRLIDDSAFTDNRIESFEKFAGFEEKPDGENVQRIRIAPTSLTFDLPLRSKDGTRIPARVYTADGLLKENPDDTFSFTEKAMASPHGVFSISDIKFPDKGDAYTWQLRILKPYEWKFLYTPKGGEIIKEFGEATTPQEVIDKVTIPNYPADAPAPTLTVVDETTIPDGQTAGIAYVVVKVTYPDTTSNSATVKVTVKEKPAPEPPDEPTQEPTQAPTQEPTDEPTEEPTQDRTQEPTQDPTQQPTEEPTQEPTVAASSASSSKGGTQAPQVAKEPAPTPTKTSTKPSQMPLTGIMSLDLAGAAAVCLLVGAGIVLLTRRYREAAE